MNCGTVVGGDATYYCLYTYTYLQILISIHTFSIYLHLEYLTHINAISTIGIILQLHTGINYMNCGTVAGGDATGCVTNLTPWTQPGGPVFPVDVSGK